MLEPGAVMAGCPRPCPAALDEPGPVAAGISPPSPGARDGGELLGLLDRQAVEWAGGWGRGGITLEMVLFGRGGVGEDYRHRPRLCTA